jgi:inosine-uridine nucleoside N-ribohydrolase
MASIPVILDCDPGHDDALAIILAAFDPRISLLAITTVAGNGPIEKVTENALRICALAGEQPHRLGVWQSQRGISTAKAHSMVRNFQCPRSPRAKRARLS